VRAVIGFGLGRQLAASVLDRRRRGAGAIADRTSFGRGFALALTRLERRNRAEIAAIAHRERLARTDQPLVDSHVFASLIYLADNSAVSEEELSPKDIEQLLRRFRHEFDLTQEQAAERLGIPVPTYRNAEYGRGFPYPRLLRLAVEAFLNSKGTKRDDIDNG
jgi:DNA-binding XRE family transcriptional regulator